MASGEHSLFFLVIVLTLVVVVPVLVLVPWLAWRYRRNASKSAYRPRWEFSKPVEIVIWGVPVVVTAVLAVILWHQAYRLDPYRPLSSTASPLEVQVVGLDWKWVFIYPDQRIATVNTLAIPAGRQVHLTLTSDTVMQSLMIPRLAGQIYAMAGMQTQLYLQADHVGQYRGENTQYNGEGFHRQKFQARAMSAKDFEQWVDDVHRSTGTLDCAAYTALQKRDVVAKPRLYSGVQPGLFEWIVGKYRIHPMPGCGSGMDRHARHG